MLRKLNRDSAGKPRTHPVKVLQFGKGNFLRGFADWMVDILNEKSDFRGGVQIVQVNAQTTDDRFQEQEGLYHVVINGIHNGKSLRDVRLITCISGVTNPFRDYASFLREGENPDLKFIISNTTEAGIEFNGEDKTPETVSASFPGKLTALLHRRYTFFHGDPSKALTVLPCELIDQNGDALRAAIEKYIAHWKLEDGFRKWIVEHTLFCNTLVDRIVPGFPKDTYEEIWKETGFEDRLVVTAEPFHLWVIQPGIRPGMSLDAFREALPLEQAGFKVKFVDDLTPYRTSKVRILNGSHTAMVPIGYLRGLRTVREVVEDTFMGDFIRKTIHEEIIPTLDMPRAELEVFAQDTMERFQNPFIRHELKSIALNSVSKYQVRVLPTVLDYLQRTGKLPERLLYALAALIVFYKGEWRGEATPVNDTPAVLEFFKKAWAQNDLSAVVDQVLSHEAFWKTDLTQIGGFSSAVKAHVREIVSGES